MEIVLKETLNEKRRLTRGTVVDWDRPSITRVSQQLGRSDWFEALHEVDRRLRSEIRRGGRVKSDG